MKIDTTRTTLARQLAGHIPDGAEVLGLVLEPTDRLYSALIKMPTGIYVTMIGDVCRSVDQAEATEAARLAKLHAFRNAAESACPGLDGTGAGCGWTDGLTGDEWATLQDAVDAGHNAGCARAGEITDTESGRLYDSETAEPVTAEGLEITAAEYDAMVQESLQCVQDEGHVRTSTGRRVYAD